MGMRYTKSDVTFHAEHWQPGVPAVNVKVRSFGPDLHEIVERYGCTEDQAQRAHEYAFVSAQDQFWNMDAPAILEDVYGPDSGLEIVSQGRSGGWCTVHGLPAFEYWDAVALAKWRKFERLIEAEVEWLKGEYAAEEIQFYLEERKLHAYAH